MEVQVLGAENYSSSLLEQLHELQQNNLHCDARLTADGGGISAHKVVLMAASPYLSSCFSTKVQSELGSIGSIHIKDMPFKLVERVVSFIYTGKLLIFEEDFDKTQKLCKDLGITEAVMLCEIYQKNRGRYTEENGGERSKLLVTEDLSETGEIKVNQDVNYVTGENVKEEPVEASCLLDNENILEEKKMDTISVEKKSRNSSGTLIISLTKEDSSLDRNFDRDQAKRKHLKVKWAGSKKVKKSSCQSNTDESQESENVPGEVTCDTGNVEDFHTDTESDKASDQMESEQIDSTSKQTEEIVLNVKIKKEKSCRSSTRKQLKTLDRRKKHVHEKSAKTSQDDKRNIKVRRFKRFPCSFCDRILTTYKRLAFHEYIKHGAPFDEKRYKLHSCPKEECSYVAENKSNLQLHMKSRHGEERPHVCEFCGKAFKLPNILAIHLNIHTGSKLWKCTTCGEQFNQQTGLSQHIKRHHLGESAWTELCHLCSERFVQKSDLVWHLFRAHSVPLPDGYKAFICDLCNYQTKCIQDFERHQNAHKGIKQFGCPLCNKKFNSKSQMIRHKQFHGEKSFKCTYDNCTYACTDSIGLGRHIKLMHTHKHLKPYICPVCFYKTGVKANLDKHIRQVHGLIVVAKHTVQLKVKYANFESGDVISKEGQLVASAKQRNDLYRLYLEENKMTMINMDDTDSFAKETKCHREKSMFPNEEASKEQVAFIPAQPLCLDYSQESCTK